MESTGSELEIASAGETVGACVCISPYTYFHVSPYIDVCIYTYICIYINHICKYVYIYICIYVCVCVYIYININNTYVYIYIYVT